MGLCFKVIEIWNLFEIWDFVYWNFWFIQVRVINHPWFFVYLMLQSLMCANIDEHGPKAKCQ